MKITCNLTSKNGVRKTIRQLEQYRDGLDAKCEKFVSRLAEVGIKTAQMHAGEYGSYIVFRKEISTLPNGCRALLIATDGQKITREWKYQDGTRTAEVSPLLMAEFGSGWLADVRWKNISGVGQGTFPGQTHAFDPYGWWWEDTDGVKHHSKGEAPTYPMYSASIEMLSQMMTIAKEVFK